jgi:hypothetical protein
MFLFYNRTLLNKFTTVKTIFYAWRNSMKNLKITTLVSEVLFLVFVMILTGCNVKSESDPVTPTSPSITRNLTGSISYTGIQVISDSSPLKVGLTNQSTFITTFIESNSPNYNINMDLDPAEYMLAIIVDLDNDDDIDEYEPFELYNDSHALNDFHIIDLTVSDQDIGAIEVDDDYLFGFLEFSWLPPEWIMDSQFYEDGSALFMTGEGNEDLVTSVYDRDNISDFTFYCDSTAQISGDLTIGDWGFFFRFDTTGYTGYSLGFGENDWGLYYHEDENTTVLITGEANGFSPGDSIYISCEGNKMDLEIGGSSKLTNYSLDSDPSQTLYDTGYLGMFCWEGSDQSDPLVYYYDLMWLVYHN